MRKLTAVDPLEHAPNLILRLSLRGCGLKELCELLRLQAAALVGVELGALPQLVPVCLLSQTQPLFSCLRLQMQAGGLMNRWGMLYCGGAPPVVKALQEISQEFSIQYKSESFGW